MNISRRYNVQLRHLFSLAVALLLIAGPTHATEQMAIFGPETYVTETGKPKKISKSFFAPQIDDECIIFVESTQGRLGKVASAVITLNGVTVVGPNELNKNVSDIRKPVSIQPQNDLEVEVRGDPGSKLVVRIVANVHPGYPARDLAVFPDGFPVNTPTPVTFSLMNPYTPSGPAPLIEIQQVSPSGDVIDVEGVMVDDGDPAMADQFAGDGIFGFRKIYEFPEPTRIKLRVQVTQDGQVKNFEPFELFTFNPITTEEANLIIDIQGSAYRLYQDLLSKKSEEKALAEVVAYLKAQPFVSDSGISPGGIWIEFANGIGGGISTNPPGTRGAAP